MLEVSREIMKRHLHFFLRACSGRTPASVSSLAIGSLFVCSELSAQSYGYTLIQLGSFSGIDSQMGGLNESGQVAGSSFVQIDELDRDLHAFLSAANGGPLKDLGTLGGTFAHAAAVNSSGQAVGYSVIADGSATHAFVSAPDGGALRDLGTLGGTSSSATDINSRGQIAGSADLAGNTETHAFLSAPDGGALKDLGTLGGSYSYGRGVNAGGRVAGTSGLVGYTTPRAFLSGRDGGPLKDLGTFPGANVSYGGSVNDAGQVTGSSGFEPPAGSLGWYHAFVSAPDGGALLDLGTLGGVNSSAGGINNSGQVVGWADLADGTPHAFIFTLAGGLQDLNLLIDPALGITLAGATGINGLGQIAAYGTDSTGQAGIFLLTAAVVPEPGIWAMLALGAGVMITGARFRRQRYHSITLLAHVSPPPKTTIRM